MEPQCEYTTHWQQERLKWLQSEEENSQDSSVNSEDYMDFPFELDKIDDIKQILKANRRPYGKFEGYLSLEDIIEQYMYIWFEETTSSD
jgi:hypothetical protein